MQAGLGILEARQENSITDLRMIKTHFEIQKYNLGLGSEEQFMEQLNYLCAGINIQDDESQI